MLLCLQQFYVSAQGTPGTDPNSANSTDKSFSATRTFLRDEKPVFSDSILMPLRQLIDQQLASKQRTQLDLFVMSQCPFGVMAEQSLTSLLKTYTGRVDFRLNFIASVSADGASFNSLHGQPEIEENIRQLVIADHFPDRLIPYLVARGKNYLSADWQSPASAVGLDTNKITQFTAMPAATQRFRENIRRAQQWGVSTSPSLFIDGNKYAGRLIDPTQNAATQCQTGTDPYTGSPYVVCTANSTYAWISSVGFGTYHPVLICQQLGYAGMGRYGGTCDFVCGYCTSGTSCNNPQTNTTFDGAGNIGTDQYGMIIGYTVHWECVGTGCPTITVTNPTITSGILGTAFNQTFTASGGSGPYTYTTSSTLPTGLTLNAAGVLSGTPAQTGTFP